ncbi:MAG: hypothetical protein ACAH11_04645 [Sphingomonas sp.]
MLARLLVCAVAMGMATPAVAAPDSSGEATHSAATSERASYTPDTLPLLMQDQRTTWGTPAALTQIAPGFDMAQAITVTALRPVRGDLASFDNLSAPAPGFDLADPARTEPAFVEPGFASVPSIRLTARDRPEPMGGATDALREGRAALPSGHRTRRTPLDARVVLKLDGEGGSPPLSFGGGVAAVLNVIPRQ